MQIYIMDSDYEVLKELDTLLNDNLKYKAKCFTNLQALVDATRREIPDVVMLDFDEQNSYKTVKIIKAENPNIKIIMMSNDKSKAINLFELNLNGFILKPIEEEKVKEQLFRLRHPLLAKMNIK